MDFHTARNEVDAYWCKRWGVSSLEVLDRVDAALTEALDESENWRKGMITLMLEVEEPFCIPPKGIPATFVPAHSLHYLHHTA